jgi:hypothetical protein
VLHQAIDRAVSLHDHLGGHGTDGWAEPALEIESDVPLAPAAADLVFVLDDD